MAQEIKKSTFGKTEQYYFSSQNSCTGLRYTTFLVACWEPAKFSGRFCLHLYAFRGSMK
jgi:hypothetical protein